MNGTMGRKRLLAAAVMLTVLAGCTSEPASTSPAPGGSKETGGTGPAAAGQAAPLNVTITDSMFTPEPLPSDSPQLKKLEEFTNAKIKINWVPEQSYAEKLTAILSSGDLPMLLRVSDVKAPAVVNAIRAGAFWELTPYIDQYPNFQRMNKQVFDSVRIDGKIYTLFKQRPLVGDGVIYRLDWAKNLGIGQPKTLDELYGMIRDFTLKDPDRNGKNDTIGLVEDKSFRGFRYALAVNGAPNGWELKDGKLVIDHMTKEYLDTLKFYKRLYSEKLMNQDFAVATREFRNESLSKGKAGMYFSDPDHSIRHPDLPQLFPGAELDVFVRLNGAKGERILMDTGYTGMWAIPKSTVKTEAELKRLLEFLNKMNEPEMENLFEWGIEGVHYTMSGGKPTRTKEQSDLYSKQMVLMRQTLMLTNGTKAMVGDDDRLTKRYKEAKIDMEPHIVPNPAAPFISQTMLERGADLKKLIDDGRVKYIMGEIDDNGWNSVVDQWLQRGGNKVIEEINAEYAKVRK